MSITLDQRQGLYFIIEFILNNTHYQNSIITSL